MNSTIGRYILALIIGGGVFGGLAYVNRDTGSEVALPAIPALPPVPTVAGNAPEGDAGDEIATEQADVAAAVAEEETVDAPAEEVTEAPADGSVSEAAEPAVVEETGTVAGETVEESPAEMATEETPVETATGESPAAVATEETVAETVEAETPAEVAQETPVTEPVEAPVATETPAPETVAEEAPTEETPATETVVEETPVEEATSQTATVAEIISTSGITAEGEKPTFDVVRVDNNGMAVIAGTAAPNSTVTIKANGKVIGEAVADASGEFVAIVQTDDQGEAQNIALESEIDGELQFSDESILVLPTLKSDAADTVEEEAAPVIVKATPEEVVVVQSGTQPTLDQISIDSVSYEETGEASVAGRGTPGNTVIAYVDNEPMIKTVISTSGTWKVVLDGLEAGNYTLRADEIGPDGEVVSRMETPFQRAFPADVQQAQQQADDAGQAVYTVQPGNSLWVIATGRYGEGLKYHQIFAANQDQIRDPDLIYPGQVFVLPEE